MKNHQNQNKNLKELTEDSCFDGTSLDICSQCPRKYYYAREVGIVSQSEAMPLTYGAAMHEFFDEYYTSGDVKEGLKRFVSACKRQGSQIPAKMTEEHPYSIEYGILLLQEYASYYKRKREDEQFETVLDSKGEPFVEISFSIDVGVGIYYGRIDRIVRWKEDNKLYIWEHKHTKNPLNSIYWDKFAINNQISNYIFAASQILNEEFGGAIINAIRIHPFKKDSSNFYEKIFQRRITTRSKEQLQDRAIQIQTQIAFIKQARKIGMSAFYQNAPSGCGFTRWRCEYEPLCMTNDEHVRNSILKGEYKDFTWRAYDITEHFVDNFENTEKIYELKGT